MPRTTQNPQTANSQNSPYANLNFQEPPNIKVIEASCDLADKRSDDNSEWENTLAQPIFVPKGSEIRCASTFLDMKGVDNEIIQFESSGSSQDNTHTLLGEIYTVNDGFNGKTCSYDYITRPLINNPNDITGQNAFNNGKAIEISSVGSNIVAGNHTFHKATVDSSGTYPTVTDLTYNLTSLADHFPINNVTITNAGIGYRTGDAIIETVQAPQTQAISFRGFVVCDDLGQIKNIVIESHGAFSHNPPQSGTLTPPVLTVSTNSGGSGASLTPNVLGDKGCYSAVLAGNSNMKLEEWDGDYTNSTGLYTAYDAGGIATNFQIRILAAMDPIPANGGAVPPITSRGALVNKVMFDQGYNYQKVALKRYCQTFDWNNNFNFGNHFLERSFITGAGNRVSMTQRPAQLLEDVALSAYNSVRRREDEFCSGIFHNGGIDDETPFLLNSATTRLGFSNNNLRWKFGWENGYCVIYAGNHDETYTIDGVDTVLKANILNRYPIGCTLSITIQGDQNPYLATEAQTQWGYLNLHRLWGGIFQVGKNEYITNGLTVNMEGENFTDYRKITLGSPRIFLEEGTTPTGAGFYLDYNNGSGNPDNATGPANTTSAPINAINVRNDGGNTMTGAGLTMAFSYDGSGNFTSYTLEAGGSGYKKGDIVKFLNPDGSDNNLVWYILQIDNINDNNRGSNGTTFSAPQGTTLGREDLVNTDPPNAYDYAVFINPIPYYQCGLGDIANRSPTLFEDNPNAICVCRTVDRVAGYNKFTNYNEFPPIYEKLGLDPDESTTQTNFTNKSALVGLYKYGGKNPSESGFNNLNAQFSSHSLMSYSDVDGSVSSSTSLAVDDFFWRNFGINTMNMTCGNTDNNAEMAPLAPTDRFLLISRTKWEAIFGTSKWYYIPNNYAKLTFQNGGVNYEEHVVFSHFEFVTLNPNAHSYLKLYFRTRQVQENEFYNFYSNDVDFTSPNAAYSPNASPTAIDGGFGFKVENRNIPQEIVSGDVVQLSWFGDESQYYNFLTAKYNKNGVGDIPFTATTNFYNTNDVNYDKLKTVTPWLDILQNNEGLTVETLNSYNNGGHYFLTHNNGYLTNIDQTNPSKIDYSKKYGFSQGFNEFILTSRIRSIEYVANRNADYFPTQSTYVQQLETNATNVFAYEPLYKQKTFKIDRDFAIPSDIGGFWTRQSHDLTGIQDILTGTDLATVDDCGILQNEFIFPVFGSNNQIDARGRYIKDKVTYPDSNGLEPGHCIGIQFIDSASEWLNNEVKYTLPTDTNNFKINNVFFRTFFTQVRNYDPLKGKSQGNPPVYDGLPDRSPFETIHTKAGLIGNLSFRTGYVKAVAAGGGNPPDPPAVAGAAGVLIPKYTLDGHLTIDSTSQGPGAAGQLDTFNVDMYELGTPNPTVTTPAFFPHSSTEYPVRYINNNSGNSLARAKISSYVGSTNLTLAYQSDLSVFTFQFFFTPYTSPFVDGTGGDISTRVFYGNRPKGLYNHDSLGGVNVSNWVRPDYPRGFMTYRESINNITSVDYPNGINPLSGVATIGKAFMNKLGYSDGDLGIVRIPESGKFKVDQTLPNIGTSKTGYVDANLLLDNGTKYDFYSANFTFDRTNKARLDSSASILSSIPAPESNAGLNNNIAKINPTNGKYTPIVNRWGDYIFYPYSINTTTNTFNSTGKGTVADPAEASRVRWDNATDTYASVGGLNLSEVGRGMGTPNTTGSTTICNPSTIPVTLNPDCNIYLSYTVQTDSDFIMASTLPRKLNHGHLIVVSDLLDEPSYHLSKAGVVNGISIINKTFITGDFILSMGQLSFYAQQDRYITRIKTRIINSENQAPTTLGSKSTVIYQIINQQPVPEKAPIPAIVQQERDYELMSYMAQHTNAQQQGTPSRLADLHNKLYQIGIATIIDPQNNNASVISQLENYVRAYDLDGMSPEQRQQFYATPEGASFLQTATNYAQLRGVMEEMDRETDPQRVAILQDRVALNLRAIDRGTDLPPVPDVYQEPNFLTDEVDAGIMFDPEDDTPVPPPEQMTRDDFPSDEAYDRFVFSRNLVDEIRGTGIVGEPSLIGGVEGNVPVAKGSDSGVGQSVASTVVRQSPPPRPSAPGGGGGGGAADSGADSERPDTP